MREDNLSRFDKICYINGINRAEKKEDHSTRLHTRWFDEKDMPQLSEPPVWWFMDDQNGETVCRYDSIEEAIETYKAINGKEAGYSIRKYEPTFEEYHEFN